MPHSQSCRTQHKFTFLFTFYTNEHPRLTPCIHKKRIFPSDVPWTDLTPLYRYGITGLKLLARRKYAGQLFEDGHWSSQIAEFADSIIEVYESTVDTDRGLRDLVIQAFREHPELARSKDIELVVRDTPGAAWELFRLGWGLPVC